MTGMMLFHFLLPLLLDLGSTTTTPEPYTPTPPLTTITRSTVPPGSCFYNNRYYADGEDIERDAAYNCYGTICESGDIMAWDHQCFFHTPECAGQSQRVPGECCPVCMNTTTTPPTTIPPSTTPPGGCVHFGKIYQNGEEINRDGNNCSGALCQDGEVIYWDDKCAFYTPVCNGRLVHLKDQCCPLCLNVTTTPPSTTSKSSVCLVDGKLYSNGQRTNRDRCHVCRCTINGTESCFDVTCDQVLDCEVRYQAVGECCYTCGCSRVITNLSVMLLLLLMLEVFQSS